MGYEYFITDPDRELSALALAYVQSQDLSGFTTDAILNLYLQTLNRMWKTYNDLAQKR